MEFKNGIYKINKPLGWTSYDVVNWIKKRVVQIPNKPGLKRHRARVGHAGTLDPAATGLLIVAIGRDYTKKIESISGSDKEYEFTMTLGIKTDSYDSDGKIVYRADKVTVSRAELLEALEKFKGKISQVPPMFSAIQQKGVRLYKLARQGIEVEREPKAVEIKELELLDFNLPTATLRVVCTKGTYVRSLCADIGETLGCGAYLSSLVRTQVGKYKLSDSDVIEIKKEEPVTVS